MNILVPSLCFISQTLLGYSIYWALRYNQPIFRRFRVLCFITGTFFFSQIGLMLWAFGTHELTYEKYALPEAVAQSVFFLFYGLFLIIGYIKERHFGSVGYDRVFWSLMGYLLLGFMSVRMIPIDDVSLLAYLGLNFIPLLLLMILGAWPSIQVGYPFYSNIGEGIDVFKRAKRAYRAYRHPSLLVIQNQKMDGAEDTILTFGVHTELGFGMNGRYLVMRRSFDKGDTWTDPVFVLGIFANIYRREVNPSAVYDESTGKIHLFYNIGRNKKKYVVQMVTSDDGGETFSEAEDIGDGCISPGHGIQLKQGDHAGRMLIPAHHHDKAYAWISDDHGETWHRCKGWVSGSESEIVELVDGRLMMSVQDVQDYKRHHKKLHQRFSLSKDGGETWGAPFEREHLKSSICRTSLARGNGKVYISYPDDYYCRCKMTLAVSVDGENTFEKYLIYQSPSAYSQVGVLSDGTVLVLFENGRADYTERITLVKLKV